MIVKIAILVFSFSIGAAAHSLELSSGVIARGKDTAKTDLQATASVAMTELIIANNGYHGRSFGYANFGLDNVWFRFYRNLSISGVNLETKSYLGNWALNRWEHEFTEQTALFYTNADLSGSELTKHYNQFISENQNDLGCLVNTPLRYGKISQSSDSDVVLTIGTLDTQADLIVFSPTYERIVFSLRYAEQNSAKAEAVAPFQYIQTTNYHAEQQAYRTYGKVYEGDFDQDGHADLITWRKIFYSHETDSTELGFFAGGEILTHYERDLEVQAASPAGITGEYLPQDTPEADIQNFLAENNLTWSKGYPSKSECPGEEGQLIPEMHDPLLNDPEVLQ